MCIFVDNFTSLLRFLHVVGSPELTNIMKTMNEMAQLEDTKRFHLSLYGQVVVHAIFISRFPIIFSLLVKANLLQCSFQGQMSKTEEKGNSRNPFGVML